MPFIEQILFGVNIKDENPERSVLAHSPGMSKETTAEIVRLCENWGTVPPLGLEQPALMSFRLNTVMPSVAGTLYTVIQASKGLNPFFHAVILSEGTYATFLRNPFAVAKAVTFCDEWSPALKLKREEIEYDYTIPLVDPPANEGDIGLVDEAVLKLIADGKLAMPIEQANAKSDRSLALIIACMPEKNRKNLRFASFATSESNNYTLVGEASEGCVFAGWQRMMLAWMSGENVEEVETYASEIRAYLEAGDMAGIARTSQRHLVTSGPKLESVDKPRRETISASVPAKATRSVLRSQPFKAPPAPAVMASAGPIKPRWDPGPVTRPKPRPISPLKRNSPGSLISSRRRTFPRAKFIRGAFFLLILALAGTAGMMWKEGRTLEESLEWANLQGIMVDFPRTERAATLLEVVDVGGVYARQLKLVTSSGKGLNPSVDKGRQKALGNLRKDAAVPLNQQVELFAKLATDGIQQGSRPDRESQRMQSLAAQGLVLENELARLDLAWFSLAAAVFWSDLSSLSDEAVIARRDSLAKAEKGALDDARRDLGTNKSEIVLEQTRGHVEGMASLLTLFEVKSWSPGWEKKLSRAAGKVSTGSSRMTRAYANSAFAFVRLKKAERKGEQASLPYLGELEDQDWPSAEIRSILTNLRAQTAMFSKGQAPSLLTGTLDLYSALKMPATLASKAVKSPRVLDDLANNRAVRFDPKAYGEFLDRIRYEAALVGLEWADDPDLIGDYLYAGADRNLVIAFRNLASVHQTPDTWDTVAASKGIPFLSRWAGHLGTLARVDLDSARKEFDTAWVACRRTAVKLQGEAVAGRDWTESWLALNEQAQGILTDHARLLAQDPERSVKMADVTNIVIALKAPLKLELQAGTIRLDQDRLPESTKAYLEIQASPGGKVWRSDKFYIGPASPDGTGWVGTVSLEETLDILPRQSLEIKIIAAKGQEILLVVNCPSLTDGVGPAGLVRPRSGGRGSVSLKIDPSYWKSLRVPDLGMIF